MENSDQISGNKFKKGNKKYFFRIVNSIYSIYRRNVTYGIIHGKKLNICN